MSLTVLILSSLGGIVALFTAIWFVVRAIIRNVHATDNNTKALDEIRTFLGNLKTTVDEHTIELAVIKDRMTRK